MVILLGRITTVNIDEYALTLYNIYHNKLGLPPRSRIINNMLVALVDCIRKAMEEYGILDGDIIDIDITLTVNRNGEKYTVTRKVHSMRVI